MAGLFLCAWHSLLDCLESILTSFASIWDSILNPLVSILEFLLAGSGKVFLSTSDTQFVQT